ncbi:MAG: phage gp6-like head-tail connector protein [Candidatus Arsenophonus phytopathogenicus]
MNERELSLVKLIGETVKEELIRLENTFNREIDSLKKDHDEKILNLKKAIAAENQEKNRLDEQVLAEKIKTTVLEEIKLVNQISLSDIEISINEKLANIVQSLPVPEQSDINTLIADAVDKLPKPEDGKSVTLKEIEPLIKQGIQKIFDAFPKPRDGKDADVEKVVEKLLPLMPKPEDGKSVTLEEVEPLIKQGIQMIFDDFPKPENGKDADPEEVARKLLPLMPKPEDGKDALQIEFLPGIDESKSYSRGTFAICKGGVWRAFQQTTGMHGWECIFNGYYDLRTEMKDARTVLLHTEMTNGEVKTHKHVIPAMIYCGVYRVGSTYQNGDIVTWGGSLWHCDEATKDKPGEHSSKGWTLIVKRGRDGRDIR